MLRNPVSSIGQVVQKFATNGFDVLMVTEDDGISAVAGELAGEGQTEAFQVDLRDFDGSSGCGATSCRLGAASTLSPSTPVSETPVRSWRPPSLTIST